MKKITHRVNLGLFVAIALVIAFCMSRSQHHSFKPVGYTAFAVAIIAVSSLICRIGINRGGWKNTKYILLFFTAAMVFLSMVIGPIAERFMPFFHPTVIAVLAAILGLVYLQNRIGYLFAFYWGPNIDEFILSSKPE